MKKILNISTLVLLMTFFGCEISINSDESCLECSYRVQGNTRTEKVCNDFGTEDDMDEMRERMQMEADSLGVNLRCERS